MRNLEKLFELVMSVGERRSGEADLIYVFAQTDANRPSVISVVGPDLPVGACGRARSPGYSGFESWHAAMVESGIEDRRILPVGATDSAPLNTLTEASALVTHCMKRRIKRVAIVAPRWHLLRCVISFVGESSRLRSDVVAVPRLGKDLDWSETVDHSQGELRARRSDLILYEILRIQRYVEAGDIPEPTSVLRLLEHLR